MATLKIYLIILFILSLSTNYTTAQSLVNTTGETIQNSSISIEYAIGEISITTLTNNQNSLTQGLLQPVLYSKDCNLLQFIPNAFTPNKDNLNDCFGVRNWPGATSFDLRVYNRWGQLVFRATTLSECWNGEFKGQPQPIGTYVYTLKATTGSCGVVVNKGTVTLIR